jgi:hydrogenase maturation protein HypF
MIENKVDSPVLGVAFDGTGYGEDGCIWGGEFLWVNRKNYRRLGHLEYIPMPGGETAIKKPYRMTISYLLNLFGANNLPGQAAFFEEVEETECELIKNQLEKRINTPLTSSCGRLFDGVSALLGIRNVVEYEGQAAIELEMVAAQGNAVEKKYFCDITEENGVRVVSLKNIFAGIFDDLGHGVSRAEIASTFHHSIAHMIAQMCQMLAKDTGITWVALSGGVFQNRLLLKLSRHYLEKAGMRVMTHKEVPCNDGGISLGQAVIANFNTEGD